MTFTPNTIICGVALTVLSTWPDECIDCVVTSPPYWGLRDYGVVGQLGLEPTPAEYVSKMVIVFDQIHRVLRRNGTLWLNMGDCYIASGRGGDTGKSGLQGSIESQDESKRARAGQRLGCHSSFRRDRAPRQDAPHKAAPGLKPKDLAGVPWRLVFALQDAGWYLRMDNVWHKPNPMPESVTDRPTKSHEYVFLLSKSLRYHYDKKAVDQPVSASPRARISQDLLNQHGSDRANGGTKSNGTMKAVVPGSTAALRNGVNPKARVPAGWMTSKGSHRELIGNYARPPRSKQNESFAASVVDPVESRNLRSVWTIPTQAFKGAHFATFPEELANICILAGCRAGGIVLDPFMGAGTVALVATKQGRNYAGIELNPAYIEMATRRLGLFAGVSA